MLLAQRLDVPDGTAALLFDLDGVILDTLALEYGVVNELLARHGIDARAPRAAVRRAFPYPIPDSWARILAAIGADPDPALVERLSADLEHERAARSIEPHAGAVELLRAAGLPIAVVSNNPAAHVEEMLRDAGVRDAVAAVVGNDGEGIRSKPAPDPYQAAAETLGVATRHCTAIEDSLIGARSARAAGCHVAGVATGAASFEQLSESPDVDRAYTTLEPPVVRLAPGDVRRKRLETPNEFVSHMLEHVAWRLGCEVDVRWRSDDWRGLGRSVGAAIHPLLDGAASSQALGMIDDGSAEVRVERAAEGHAALTAATAVDVDWFTSLRCEQLRDGRPLLELMDGLAEGAGVAARVEIVSLEDPHHTWEAVWRGLGTALRGMSRTLQEPVAADGSSAPAAGGLEVIRRRPDSATVRRTTAETSCAVSLAVGLTNFACRIETGESVRAAGLGVEIDFAATLLSSSHVAAEDIGMTIGAALRVLATERMASAGIEGAGSSLNGEPRPIRVGISFEGRKFVRLVPVGWSRDDLRRTVIGQTLANGLFSEDLDDFVDGFAGGMGCSVVIHWDRLTDPDEAWALVFEGLGTAVAQLLAPNAARRGVIAGVKGTLA